LSVAEDRRVHTERSSAPPFAATCRAESLAGTTHYSRCLVDETILCCYRSGLLSLGFFCLHPRHQEIVAQTSA
jgi:hypothetical protein